MRPANARLTKSTAEVCHERSSCSVTTLDKKELRPRALTDDQKLVGSFGWLRIGPPPSRRRLLPRSEKAPHPLRLRRAEACRATRGTNPAHRRRTARTAGAVA